MPFRPLPLVLCAVLVTACSPRVDESESYAEPVPLTAAHVSNLMAADGAAHTLAVLTGPADHSGFDQVTAGIATGDADWLAVAQGFRPHAEGWPAERLDDALAAALPQNAAGVLAVLGSTGTSARTCRPGPSSAATVTAFRAVTDPSMAEVKQQCLDAMREPAAG